MITETIPQDDVRYIFEEFITSLLVRTERLREAILASTSHASEVVCAEPLTPRSLRTNFSATSPRGSSHVFQSGRVEPQTPRSALATSPRSDNQVSNEVLSSSNNAFNSNTPIPLRPHLFERVPCVASHSAEDPMVPLGPVRSVLENIYDNAVDSNHTGHPRCNRWLILARALLRKSVQSSKLRSVWLVSHDSDFSRESALEFTWVTIGRSVNIEAFQAMISERRTGDVQRHDRWILKHVVRHPDSLFTSIYAAIVCAVVLFELASSPLIFAFESEHDPDLDAFRNAWWFTSCFWSFDVPMSCFQGFYTAHDILEMRIHYIALKYLKSWLVYDCVLNVTDWLSCITMLDRKHEVGFLQFAKLLRFGRLLRVVRLHRAGTVIKATLEGLFSDYIVLYARLLRLLTVILFISHYISCAWCALALRNKDNTSWIQAQGLENRKFVLQYLSSLHWSLTQFTPATNNIAPTNGQERLFATLVVIFGLVMFSAFVSSLTSNVTELKRMRNLRSAEESQIKLYMRNKRVPLYVYRQVWTYYKTHYQIRKGAPNESTFAFFQQLPTSLRRLLRWSIQVPLVSQHPIFWRCRDFDTNFIGMMCETAVTERFIANVQEVFCDGDLAACMLFLESGTLFYSCDFHQINRIVTAPHFISEATLWIHWVHCGLLTAKTVCNMFEVNAAEFEKNICQGCFHPTITVCLRKYAAQYAQMIEDSKTDGNPPATDLMLPLVELDSFAKRAFLRTGLSRSSVGSQQTPAPGRSFASLLHRAFSLV